MCGRRAVKRLALVSNLIRKRGHFKVSGNTGSASGVRVGKGEMALLWSVIGKAMKILWMGNG